jgi:hypothetical protein
MKLIYDWITLCKIILINLCCLDSLDQNYFLMCNYQKKIFFTEVLILIKTIYLIYTIDDYSNLLKKNNQRLVKKHIQ